MQEPRVCEDDGIQSAENLVRSMFDAAEKQLPERWRVIDTLQARVERRQERVGRKEPLPRSTKLGGAGRQDGTKEGRKRTRAYKKQTKRLRTKANKERSRLSEWMKHLHYAAARILTSTYSLVICPVLEVSRVVRRAKRKLNSRAVRKILAWSHDKFRQRLIWVAERDGTSHVLCPGEPGTTKTCTMCGQWMQDVKLGQEVLKCPHCRVSTDRQKAGARNNFLAAYTEACGYGFDGIDDRGTAAGSSSLA
jgi:transposase